MTKTDPTQLAAFAVLIREGWKKPQIKKSLRISERTYFRRIAETRRVEREALRLMRND